MVVLGCKIRWRYKPIMRRPDSPSISRYAMHFPAATGPTSLRRPYRREIMLCEPDQQLHRWSPFFLRQSTGRLIVIRNSGARGGDVRYDCALRLGGLELSSGLGRLRFPTRTSRSVGQWFRLSATRFSHQPLRTGATALMEKPDRSRANKGR